MSNNFNTCPSCGKKILQGAMRCVGCGSMLKTHEEQADSITRLQNSRRKFNIAKTIKFIIFSAGSILIYIYYKDKIMEVINSLFSKL